MAGRLGGRSAFSSVPARVRWIIYFTAFSSIGYGYLLTVIAAYLPEIGLSSGEVGLILGSSGLTLVVAAVPLGILADRKGRKKLLVAALLGLPPTLLVYGLTTDFLPLLIAGILGGVAEGSFLSTWNALIADQTTLENRDASFALSFVVNNGSLGTGMALPILFPGIVDFTGLSSQEVHSMAFLALAALAMVSPIGLSRLLKDYREEQRTGPLLVRGPGLKNLLRFSGINSLIGLGAGFIVPLIPTWLFLKFGVPDTYSGPLLALASITIGFAAILSSKLACRIGSVRTIVLTQGLSMMFMVSIPLASGAALASVLVLIRAGLMNMSSPVANSFLMGIVTKEERGLASAINSLIWRLPNSVSTVFGGMLLAAGMYDLPFFIAASFYAVAIALFFLAFRDTKITC